jgi:hypothetical protein
VEGKEVVKDIQLGRYDNISIDDYHRNYPGWSKSALDKVHRSMAHYLSELESPKEQTEAMFFGSAFHTAILEPLLFEKSYFSMPKIDKRTKEGKEEYARQILNNVGKQPLSEDQFDRIEAMRKSINEHPIAGNLFVNGDAEHSFFWIDKTTGLLCKCRPDYLRRDGICVELKTTKDASYDSFQKDIANFRYYVQGSFFRDGINACNVECNEFLICAVETEAPFNVNVFRLDNESLNAGRVAYNGDLYRVKQFFETEESERFAGYLPVVHDMYLPPWIK